MNEIIRKAAPIEDAAPLFGATLPWKSSSVSARELIVDGVRIADDTPCFTIAEIGANHQGDVEICKQLFDAARAAGATCIKMQKRNNSGIFTQQMYDSDYQSPHAFAKSYGAHREYLEFDKAQYAELKAYADAIGIAFLATAYDEVSADFLARLGVGAYKIASCDLINTPLLRHVAALGKPMFVSTGGATMDDIQRAYETVMPINEQLCLLQCTSAYPPKPEEMNLAFISTLRQQYPELVIGFSSHDDGIAFASIAYALGARVVEKHFTLDRSWKGSDHACSIEPPLLRQMVQDLEAVRVALGDGVKRRYDTEAKSLHKLAKKLVAADDLPANIVIGPEHLAIKSPGDGEPPHMFDEFIGRRLRRSLRKDENLMLSDTILVD